MIQNVGNLDLDLQEEIKKYNLPNTINTIKDLVYWLDKEIGLDTEINEIEFDNDLCIFNRSVFNNYNISFYIDKK